MMIRRCATLIVTATMFCAAGSAVQGAEPALALRSIATGLTQPVFVTHAPSDPRRLYIVEQRGKIKTIRDGAMLAAPMLDVGPLMTGSDAYTLEYGLLGLVFHPDFATNRLFYVNFTVGTSTLADTVIMRYRMSADADVADPASGQLILRIPYTRREHRAGWLGFGPDGHLYIPTGDGGENDPLNNASNLAVLAGKILRIDVNGPDGTPGTADDDGFPADPNKHYRVPANNPFVAQAGAAPEVWSYGLRNPWRCSFDRLTSDLWIGDVGQFAREEINMIGPGVGGAFFGWRCMEGTQATTLPGCTPPLPPSTLPVYDYGRDQGSAVIGGYVYRGCLMPELRGTYFFGDWSRKVWSFRLVSGTVTQFTPRTELTTTSTFVSFGEDFDGELYMCRWSGSAAAGEVLKIVEAGRPIPDCNANTIDDALEVCRGLPLSPAITASPSDTTKCPAFAATFNAGGTGAQTVRWQREASPGANTWVDLSDGSSASWDGGNPAERAVIAGATTPTLTVAPDTAVGASLGLAHAIRYRWRAANGCGEASTPPAKLSLLPDLTGDGAINTADLVVMLGNFAQVVTTFTAGDLNGDGQVNTIDLVEFLGGFGAGCP